MEKTAKITRTVFKNEWQNPKGGSVFYHDIELDNGDKGSIGSKEKEPSKLNPGSDLTYTIEKQEKGGFKIKAVVPQNGFGGNGFTGKPKAPANNSSFALSYAKDLVIAKINNQTIGAKEVSIDEVFSLADRMYNWMEGKK